LAPAAVAETGPLSATTPTAIENLTRYDDTPQFRYLTK